VLLAIEGIAGAGKSTVRDQLLAAASAEHIPVGHIGQFSWLSLAATRIIIALRAGQTPVSEDAALAAVHQDLLLHARYNLAAAHSAGHVIADRLTLSSACLLALLYNHTVERYLRPLAAVTAARPEVTLLLTTPISVCTERLRSRQTVGRFGEAPEAAARFAELYEQGADAWVRLTDQVVLRRPSSQPHDTYLLVADGLAKLRQTVALPRR